MIRRSWFGLVGCDLVLVVGPRGVVVDGDPHEASGPVVFAAGQEDGHDAAGGGADDGAADGDPEPITSVAGVAAHDSVRGAWGLPEQVAFAASGLRLASRARSHGCCGAEPVGEDAESSDKGEVGSDVGRPSASARGQPFPSGNLSTAPPSRDNL